MHIYNRFPRFFRIRSGEKVPVARRWQTSHFSWSIAQKELDNGHNIGFALPPELLVLDVDPRNGGTESYERLLLATGLPELSLHYPTVLTGGGGIHYYMRLYPADQVRKYGGNPDFPGLDIKTLGGYVLTAGSKTAGIYRVFNDPKRCPYAYPKLLRLFEKIPSVKEKKSAIIEPEKLAEILSKIDPRNYDSNELWFPLLCAAHNATGGMGLEVFLDWSTQDPRYLGYEASIAARWDSLRDVDNPRTLATILAELPEESRREIQVSEFDSPESYCDPRNAGAISEIAKTVAAVQGEIEDIALQMSESLLASRKIIRGAEGQYWEYVGTHWESRNDNYVHNLLMTLGREAGISKNLKAAVLAAESYVCWSANVTFIPGAEKRSGQSVVNCTNGELWINETTGEAKLRPHNPESYLTSCLPIEYDPKAKCSRFDSALYEIFIREKNPHEIIRHLWELIGYTIQGKKNVAAFVMFYGRGSNGKGVILSVLQALLGEASRNIVLGDLKRDVHGIARLPGALAVIDDDLLENMVLPSDVLKKLSENTRMEANPKFLTPYSFVCQCTPWLACNTWPKTRDRSNGTKRRAHIFEFKREFKPDQRDDFLKERIIDDELPGVLNRALEGLRRFRLRQSKFDVPTHCRNQVDKWYSLSDPLHHFIRDRMFVTTKKCKFDLVWREYQLYCSETGIDHRATKHGLSESFIAHGYTIEKERGTYYIHGIRVAGEKDKEKQIKNLTMEERGRILRNRSRGETSI